MFKARSTQRFIFCLSYSSLRHRRGCEDLAQLAQNLDTLSLEDRLEAAELEPAELDTTLGAERAKAEVRPECVVDRADCG